MHDPELSARVYRKAARRLIPFLCLLYVFNILDRVNLGFARGTMQPDLKLSDSVFDFGYGLFYFGYLLFEVPSNLLLRRVGARLWIARIMVSWGIVSVFMLAVTGPESFYVVRILLGVAEAGFFPGIILYLTYWFTAKERARVVAYFMGAIAVANICGNPISGAILHYMDNFQGLKGWQWVFLLEGLPTVVLGILVLLCLPDGPADATWLTDEERRCALERVANEDISRRERHAGDLARAFLDARVWYLIAIYFMVAVGANASGAYLPKIVGGQFGTFNKFWIGVLSALPHVCALIGMIVLGSSSDRTGERPKHLGFAFSLAASGWALVSAGIALAAPELALVGLCVAQTGMMSALPIFWAVPPTFLTGAAAAGGIALINSVANIGGWFGPNILGAGGLPAMVGAMSIGCVLSLLAKRTVGAKG